MLTVSGSSPRVWGTQMGIIEITSLIRFIPTGVGNASKTIEI